MTALQTVTAGEGADTVVNQNFDAVSPAGMYGRRAAATSGLNWGYYGGRAFGATIADGAVTLSASSTNYIVANRSTGAVSVATNTTNWNNNSAYYRLYQVVTGTSTVTSYDEFRELVGGNGVAWSSLTGVPQPVLDVAALVDPNADRLLFWDDSAGVHTYLTLGAGLSITGTTINASADRSAVTALAIASGVVNIDCSLGDYFTLALNANVTSITFSNLPAAGKGASLMIRITQDTTPRTVAWPASFRWEGAGPAVSTGSGAVDLLAITSFDSGTKWDGTLSKGRA